MLASDIFRLLFNKRSYIYRHVFLYVSLSSQRPFQPSEDEGALFHGYFHGSA